ncbi:MAG: hypothetical protein Q9214_001528 [Letrouitia sp. 1 TL-2023]
MQLKQKHRVKAEKCYRSPWEIHYHDASQVGANMAEFAIGSISYMASRNPHISFRGNLTHLGEKLDPHWQSAIPLLLVIVAAHFALFIAAVLASKSAVIKDDSALAIARLLRPLVDVLGDSGTAMSGKEISEKIGEQKEFEQGVVYGPRVDTSSGRYCLDIGNDVRTEDGWPGGRHPDGTYH